MNTSPTTRPIDAQALRQLTQLLSGLESQKAELGPIADELLELLRALGVEESAQGVADITPSHG